MIFSSPYFGSFPSSDMMPHELIIFGKSQNPANGEMVSYRQKQMAYGI
jgi:hypothetical protein